MIGGPGQPARGGTVIPVPVEVADADRHDPTTPGDRSYPQSIVGQRRGCSRRRGAVAVHVVRVRIAVVRVPARHQLRSQVRVRPIHTRVQNGDNDPGIPRGRVPGRGRADLGQVPLTRIEGIIRREVRFRDPVQLRVFDVRIVGVRADPFSQGQVRGQFDNVHVQLRNPDPNLSLKTAVKLCHRLRRGSRAELHQHSPGNIPYDCGLREGGGDAHPIHEHREDHRQRGPPPTCARGHSSSSLL